MICLPSGITITIPPNLSNQNIIDSLNAFCAGVNQINEVHNQNPEVKTVKILFDGDYGENLMDSTFVANQNTAYYVFPGTADDYPQGTEYMEQQIQNLLLRTNTPAGKSRGVLHIHPPLYKDGMRSMRRDAWYELGINPIDFARGVGLVVMGLKYIGNDYTIHSLNRNPAHMNYCQPLPINWHIG